MTLRPVVIVVPRVLTGLVRLIALASLRGPRPRAGQDVGRQPARHDGSSYPLA